MEQIFKRGGIIVALSEIKEIQELPKSKKWIGNTTKAFENGKREIRSVRHIATINECLEGKTYPSTDVEYRKRYFIINGERVEGVFPRFDSKFDTMLPRNMFNASDSDQFKYCTEKLNKRIQADADLAKQFTPRQLEQIKNGEPRISGLTWHHNEFPRKMQLVDANEHNICRHTGGRSIWGGGSDCR